MNDMEVEIDKERPKMIFLRPPNNIKGGEYYDYLFKPRDETLSNWFDLSVVHSAKELLNSLGSFSDPVLLVYFNLALSKMFFNPAIIKEITRYTGPKLALLNSDPFAYDRSQTKGLIESLKFDSLIIADPVLTNYVKYETLPIFYWLWSINSSLFPKKTSNRNGLFISSRNNKPLYYSWRVKMGKLIEQCFEKQHKATNLSWKKYQKTIAQSIAGYTCGSVTNTLVNKHLEIPASGACLITEPTWIVQHYGFKHLESAIFIPEGNIEPAVLEVLADPEKLKSIGERGRRLVMNKHTHSNRSIVYELYLFLKKGDDLKKYRQNGPLEKITEGENRVASPWAEVTYGRDLKLIKKIFSNAELTENKIDFYKEQFRRNHPDFLIAEADYSIRQKKWYRLSKIIYYFTKMAKVNVNIIHFDPDILKILQDNKNTLPIEYKIFEIIGSHIKIKTNSFYERLRNWSLYICGYLWITAVKYSSHLRHKIYAT